jgi:O-acetyl-ADP-ribose deacetylase (regulator of RNase III)
MGASSARTTEPVKGRCVWTDSYREQSIGPNWSCMEPQLVDGDLLAQDTEVIVNAWNRNIIPWWLLLPQGVSGAIKREAGYRPFVELGRAGPIPLGGAVATSAGRLRYKAIIHVAGIDMLWRASSASIQGSVRSAMSLVSERSFSSVAFPIIGAGSGSYDHSSALDLMVSALRGITSPSRVVIVRYQRSAEGGSAPPAGAQGN